MAASKKALLFFSGHVKIKKTFRETFLALYSNSACILDALVLCTDDNTVNQFTNVEKILM